VKPEPSRENIRRIAEDAYNKSPKELLRILFERVHNPHQSEEWGRMMADFAALFAAISKESSEAAERNLRVQNRLLFLTVVILIVSLIAALPTADHIYHKLSGHGTSNPEQIHPGNQTPEVPAVH
jgi:mannitol-1-phosphate/altronate dehydrogenase